MERMSPDQLPRQDGEEWRELPGYAGTYAVSSHGRVARLVSGTRLGAGDLLAGSIHRVHGHRQVQLTNPRAVVSVHRLVWETFRGAIPADRRVTHTDDVLTNDRLDNLDLASYQEQTTRLFRTGKLTPWQGHANGNPRAVLSPDQKEQIRAAYAAGGITQTALAARYGVHQTEISAVVRGAR